LGELAQVKFSRLFRKALLLQVLLFGFIALAACGIAGWNLSRNLTAQFQSSGIAIAKTIADSAADVIVNRDLSSLQSLIDQFAEADGVSYVLITDSTGDIVVHTMVPEVPAEVQRMVHDGQEAHGQRVLVSEAAMDVSSPILGGRAGVVHVGMNRHAITARIWESIWEILAILAVVFLINVVLAFIVMRRISLPLLALADHAGTLAVQGLASTPPTQRQVESIAKKSDDEVGQLASSYLHMQKTLQDNVKQIEKSHAELEEHSQTLERKVVDRTKEITEKNEELQTTMENLRAAQQQIIQQEKMASLGGLTAGIAHEIKNPLNFVNNFSELSLDLTRELREEITKAPDKFDPEIAQFMQDLIGDLEENIRRINQHGKRADSIVRNMLLHSRGARGEQRPTDINALLDEYVGLAYHAFRAKDPNFNITIEKDYDPSIGMINIVPQDMSRVFLNIVNNACYAAHEKQRDLGDSFTPTVRIQTRNLGDFCEIRIRDNGKGIPQPILKKVFDPFFTTKPAGEGTGLGLSLSYETVVQDHKGELHVETEEGGFAEFNIRLPMGNGLTRAARQSN
jgi:signal transduction histidine kinase